MSRRTGIGFVLLLVAGWLFAVSTVYADSFIISPRSSATLGGLSFQDGDLVLYNSQTGIATLFFSESNFTSNEDIDAVHVFQNGMIALSTLGAATLGGLSFEPGDVVLYDPVTDVATLLFDHSAFSTTADVDAVSVLETGELILSTLGSATLGGLSFLDGDVVRYDPVTNTAVLLFSESTLFGGAAGNIDALHVLRNGSIDLHGRER